ncbi:MAG: hypothetical protein DME52_00150 [Verrucomicrobia bacterium]|jgi:hypothetical protein|nr:MAG: hypothetical protein DME84_04365 [Verrucomicrobiota bacterium]PYK28686.1 MAG: hypothetical protein DME52_00150 [Verrucomicrobiota bacterium]
MARAAIFISIVLTAHVLRAATLERSVSPSREFVIYGADAQLRGAVSDLAERTKVDCLALLRQRDNWIVPVVVNLQPQQANLPEIPPADLRFSQTGFGLKLQVDLTISKNLDASLMERELLRAILLEMIYRKESHIAAGSVFVEPPDWLIDGVLALSPTSDHGQLIEALTTAHKTESLETFLRQRPKLLDSAGRTLYRAYSFALVQMLIDGRNGLALLAHYISHLSNASNEPLADLKTQFPFLGGDVERTWQLTLSQLRNLQMYQFLTFAESERYLDELLRVKISEANKPARLTGLDELARHKVSASEKMALSELNRELLVFVAQANPVLRPLAREYQEIVALLARGKRKRIAKRLSRLEVTRKELAARMSDIDDYMNWFEATQMKSRSGNFTGYLKAANHSQLSAPKRHDPLSVYVDALEDQFEN